MAAVEGTGKTRCGQTLHCDVAIVGGGPAGLSAARALREMGVSRVAVLEREVEPGGIPRHCGHPPFGLQSYHRVMTGPVWARRVAEDAVNAGATILTRTHVTQLLPGGQLAAITPEGPLAVQARRVLLATGARETPRSARLVSGVRAHGILTTGALQALVHLQGLVPFRRPLIVGSELVSLSALLTCRRAGIRPVMMIDDRPEPVVRGALRMAPSLFGVPLRTGCRIVRIEGESRVTGVLIMDEAGNRHHVVCDGVLFTGRFVPESALARLGHLDVDPGSGGPVVDQFWRCSDPAYYVAGNLLRPVEHHDWCWREGRQAAKRIHADLAGETGAVGGEGTFTLAVSVHPPLKYVVPQRIVLSGAGTADPSERLFLQMRCEVAARGRLVFRMNGHVIHAVRIRAWPERRILVPLPFHALPKAPARHARLDIELETDVRS